MKLKDEAKEKRIKEKTLRLVYEHGIAGVKMGQVAKSAQLSPSMIYTYFKNKEDLLQKVFMDSAKKLINSVATQPDESLPYKMQLLILFEKIINLKRSKSIEFSFIRNFIQSPYFKLEYHQLLKQEDGMHRIYDWFEKGQQQMIIKDTVDVDFLIALVDGFTDKLIEFHHAQRINLTENKIKKAFNLIWDGVRQ